MVNQSEQLRSDSLQGFHQAADDLVANLRLELDHFKKKVTETPESFVIEHKPGYTGGGNLGIGYFLALLALGSLGIWLDRKKETF